MSDTVTEAQAPPEGFKPLPSGSPFVQRAGTFYFRKGDDGSFVGGAYITRDQTNLDGFAHGGFLLTFADFVISYVTVSITINLTADFMRGVRLGEWVELKCFIRKRSASLLFADAIATSGDREVMRVSGVFKPLERS